MAGAHSGGVPRDDWPSRWLQRIVKLSVPVSDLERSKRFYTDVLGFAIRTEATFAGDRWLELAPPGGGPSITLVNHFPAMPPGSLQGLVLQCVDAEAAFRLLSERGVEFTSDLDRAPWGTEATFRDPDGNGWVLQSAPLRGEERRMMRFKDVTIVSVPVSDQERAKTFYVDKLGFELKRDDTSVPGMRWVQVAPRGATTSLTLVTWFDSMPPGSLRGLVLSSEDLDADYKELVQKGVEFEGPPRTQPWGAETVLHDPDGNSIVLQQA